MRPSNLPASTAILRDMPPAKAEIALKSAIIQVFDGTPKSVCEVMVTPEIELRIERTSSGATFELNNIETIEQFWKKDYRHAKWALRAAINRIVEAELGVQFESDFSRRKPAEKSESEVKIVRSDNGLVWREIPTAFRYEADVGTTREKITISVLPFEDGTVDATFTWMGAVFHQSFDSLWDAKSNSLKVATSLLEWKDSVAN
jgi:hypothetical protein